MKKIVCLLIILTFHIQSSSSQNGRFGQDIEHVLILSKNNRQELECFLDYYRSGTDTLKRNAAYFLVRHMDIHYSEVFYWVDSTTNKVVKYDELSYPDFSHALKAFKGLASKYKMKPVITQLYDMHHIKADYLINNLERAFKAWQSPQAKHLTFEEFCEYILPYRNATENLEDWREPYTKTFAPGNPQSRNNSVKDVANLLNNKLTGYFVSSYAFEDKNNPVSFLSPSQLLFRKRGYCEDMVNLTWFAFKSQGIPCRIDLVPYWGTSTGRHYWNATIDERHNILPFEGSKNAIDDFTMKREPAKVISLTYSKQPDALASLIPQNEIPSNFLRNYNYKDVTDLYWNTSDLTCKLFDKPNNGIAYIAVFNGLNWQPVYWGNVTTKNIVSFPKMGCGTAYLPVIYENNKLKPAGHPVLLAENKETKTLKPDPENLHTVIIKDKDGYLKLKEGKRYRLFYWDNKWNLINTKTASKQPELSFDNVPKNALLLLVSEYSQGKERPFYITSKGERIYW